MSSETSTRFRRFVSFVIPLFALISFVLIGRRTAPAATVNAVSSSGDASDESPQPDAAVSTTETSVDAPQKSAIEQAADGGLIVDLNLATEDDLRKLPGVGPARAKRILELRSRLGKFKSVDDLARIKGFGRSTLKRLRPLTRAGN